MRSGAMEGTVRSFEQKSYEPFFKLTGSSLPVYFVLSMNITLLAARRLL